MSYRIYVGNLSIVPPNRNCRICLGARAAVWEAVKIVNDFNTGSRVVLVLVEVATREEMEKEIKTLERVPVQAETWWSAKPRPILRKSRSAARLTPDKAFSRDQQQVQSSRSLPRCNERLAHAKGFSISF